MNMKDQMCRAVGGAVFAGSVLAGWGGLIGVTGLDIKNTVEAAERVPHLQSQIADLQTRQIPDGFMSIPAPVVQARIARPLPSVSALEGDMLVIAVYAEAANQGELGMQAVASAILNRTGTKHGLTLAEVLRSPRQFSFVNVTRIGKLIGRNSQEAIRAEAAKPQYAAVRRALRGMTASGTYRDYAAGADYYYNPAASSREGNAWFQKNTVPVMRLGAHVFCKLKGAAA
jgi:spore germination cell wall hydrolase CwlJ-like protein